MDRQTIINQQLAFAEQNELEASQHLINAAIADASQDAEQARASRASADACLAAAAIRRQTADQLGQLTDERITVDQLTGAIRP